MDNALIHVGGDPARAAAFKAAAEADGHVVALAELTSFNPVDGSKAEIVAADIGLAQIAEAEPRLGKAALRHTPLVMLIGDEGEQGVAAAGALGASTVLRRDAPGVEVAARLRAVSRLRMLRDEVAARGGQPYRTPRKRRIALVGVEDTAEFTHPGMTLIPFDRGRGALVAAANSRCDAVVLDALMGLAECRAFISQMRSVASMRSVPVLVRGLAASEGRNAEWLGIGANDLLFASPDLAVSRFQMQAACERRDLVEALKRLARDGAGSALPAGEGPAADPVTGLANAAGLEKAIAACSKRLFAQNKPMSVLVISPDAVADGTMADKAMDDTVAAAISDVLRRSLRGFDFASRLNGNTFAILMPATTAESAANAAARLCAEIASERIRFGSERKSGLTCSIGVASAADAGVAQSITARALAALQAMRLAGHTPGQVARAA